MPKAIVPTAQARIDARRKKIVLRRDIAQKAFSQAMAERDKCDHELRDHDQMVFGNLPSATVESYENSKLITAKWKIQRRTDKTLWLCRKFGSSPVMFRLSKKDGVHLPYGECSWTPLRNATVDVIG